MDIFHLKMEIVLAISALSYEIVYEKKMNVSKKK